MFTAYDTGGDWWIVLDPRSRKFCDVGQGKKQLARKIARMATHAYRMGQGKESSRCGGMLR